MAKNFCLRSNNPGNWEEKALPPRKSVQRSRQTRRDNQSQHNNGGEQRKLQIGTHQFFSF
ncbi:hypothetical protein TUM17577_28950 [Enterobacter asburiae]|nr:hypothetical protein TUM17577_28950 [Enterobacter asburiae]